MVAEFRIAADIILYELERECHSIATHRRQTIPFGASAPFVPILRSAKHDIAMLIGRNSERVHQLMLDLPNYSFGMGWQVRRRNRRSLDLVINRSNDPVKR